jgi:hypothetical protein
VRVPVLSVLIAGLLSGLLGFAIGQRTRVRPEGEQANRRTNPQEGTLEGKDRNEASQPRESHVESAAPKPLSEETAPRRKVLALLREVLSEEKQFWALRNAVLQDPETQSRVFDELMGTDDVRVLEAARECLWGLKDPELARRVVDSFQAEANSDRKAALAFVMSMNLNYDFVRSSYESILAGTDARLLESAIGRMCVQNVNGHHEFTTRLIPRLRELVISGATPSLRGAATSALMGDESPEGVAFLVDQTLNDPDPELQKRAMYALPIAYGADSRKLAEQIRPLITVAFDSDRSEEMRRFAADRILHVTLDLRHQALITEDQRAILKKLAQKPQ